MSAHLKSASCTHWCRFVALMLVAWMMPAYALDYADGKVQAHGFLSQGIVFTGDNNFLGTSQNGSLDFREVGVNLSWRPNPDFQMSGQLLSHRAGESDSGSVRVDYAFADLTALSSETKRGGVRIGRVKTPFGLYNKTRDVAFTRPSIILPQSIYFERTRNLAIATDGVEFYLEHNGETSNLYLNAALGWQDTSDQATEVAFLGKRHPGKLTSGFDQFLQVMYEGDGGRYRLGMTASWLNLDYQRRDDLVLKSGHHDFDPIIFSGQYNAEHWNLTAEYAVRPSKTSGYGAIPDSKIIGESSYVQGAYQVLPKLEALLRYDVFYGNRDDRDGKAFETATKRPAFTRFAKDWTMGLRYDVTPTFMVAAEYHRVNGTGWLPVLDNPDATKLKQHWDMFMLLGSFRF